jgi:hypothetical protein
VTGAEAEQRPSCPVCRARYRGTATCSRCGADLEPLMRLMAEAFRLRRGARQALRDGDHRTARELAASARELHDTPHGQRLELLGRWLETFVGD